MENSRLEDLIQDIWKDDKGLVRHGMNNSSRRASTLANCGSARSAGANEEPPNPDSDTKQRILNLKGGRVGVFSESYDLRRLGHLKGETLLSDLSSDFQCQILYHSFTKLQIRSKFDQLSTKRTLETSKTSQS
jgi:hypothetical protein